MVNEKDYKHPEIGIVPTGDIDRMKVLFFNYIESYQKTQQARTGNGKKIR